MAFDFPAAPTAGQVFTPIAGGPSYIWQSPVWRMITGGLGVVISDTPPTTPYPGMLWWESDTGNTFIWYVDAAGPGQWVQFNFAPKNAPAPSGEFKVAEGAPGTAATLDIPVIGGFRKYTLEVQRILPSVLGFLCARISQDGGLTYPNGASSYAYGIDFVSSVSASGWSQVGNALITEIIVAGVMSTTPSNAGWLEMEWQAATTEVWRCMTKATFRDERAAPPTWLAGGTQIQSRGHGCFNNAVGPITNLRIFNAAGGTISHGGWQLNGRK